MHKLLNLLLAAAVFGSGLWLGLTPSQATVEYGKNEKKACTYCHPAGKFKEFTEAGKYYKEHEHSFKGYVEPQEEKGKK
jgi:hypothetical protein